MKKWLSLFLILVLLCTLLLPACEVPPKVAVLRAYTRTALLNEYAAQIDTDIRVSAPYLNYSAAFCSQIDIRAENALSSTPKLEMTLHTAEWGKLRPKAVIYSDGKYFYIRDKYSDSGTKIGLDQLEDHYEELKGSEDLFSDMLTSLSRDILTNSTIQKEKDTITVHTALNEEQLRELYGDIMDDVGIADSDASDTTLEHAEIELTVRDGYVQDYRLAFEFVTKKSTHAEHRSCSIKLTLHDPGSAVTVTMPEGYTDYKEPKS